MVFDTNVEKSGVSQNVSKNGDAGERWVARSRSRAQPTSAVRQHTIQHHTTSESPFHRFVVQDHGIVGVMEEQQKIGRGRACRSDVPEAGDGREGQAPYIQLALGDGRV